MNILITFEFCGDEGGREGTYNKHTSITKLDSPLGIEIKKYFFYKRRANE